MFYSSSFNSARIDNRPLTSGVASASTWAIPHLNEYLEENIHKWQN